MLKREPYGNDDTLASLKHSFALSQRSKILSNWFFVTAFFVMGMVVLGGLTRLTGSGLSMVNWRPITGFLPPLNIEQWQAVFDLYKESPQYQTVNFGMGLDDFKDIFWLEYIHRLGGRFIGILFLIPLLYSLRYKELRTWAPRVLSIWVLGGLQGLMGWYMVKSGLVDDPWVSPFRLCAHLLLAFLTCSLLVWYGFKAGYPRQISFFHSLRNPLTFSVFLLLILTICYGAFVAGMKAGLIYNTFPLMGGDLIPEELLFHRPWPINFVQNPVTVQFTHRVLAISTVVMMWVSVIKGLKHSPSKVEKRWLIALLFGSLIQVILGISTLVMHVPYDLAIAHQAGALVLLLIFLGKQYFLE